MKKLLLVLIACSHGLPGQILLNGDFSLGAVSWGCSPETNVETLYGGSNGSNTVAEVDAAANLCQTVTGLTIGQVYALSLSATRRTGGCPSPLVTNMDVTMSGGALAVTVTRTNTTFGFTTTGLLFTATSSSHSFTFAAGSGFGGSTCGMIVDNLAVTTSALPIELLEFEGVANSEQIVLSWATATEKNNDHFEIERSNDGVDFQQIISMPSKAVSGNSATKLSYEAVDNAPLSSFNYYRLKQVDKDKSYTFSKIIAVDPALKRGAGVILQPNPSDGRFTLHFASKETSGVQITLVNILGKTVYSQICAVNASSGNVTVDLPEEITAGHYQCLVSGTSYLGHFPVLIER